MGIRIGIYAIIFLSVTILFFPIQQGYAIFALPSELNEQEQLANAEQARDEIFVLFKEKNPYLDSPSDFQFSFSSSTDVQVSFEDNSENVPQVINRHREIFLTIKNEQVSIAEKKCKEILGGKTILNSINDEPEQKKTTLGFKIDNQTGTWNRDHDDFQNYRLLQIMIAEDTRDNNWQDNRWSSNPYHNDESIEVLSDNNENKILELKLNYRQSEEFKNLIIEQIFQAEKIRNEILDVRITNVENPYLNEDIDEDVDEDVDENVDEFSIKTNTDIVIDWSDPTYVTGKPEFNIIDRNAEGFEMVKAMELGIAQNTLNKMLMLSNSEKDDVKIVIFTNENKKLNNYELDDKGFEFFKNKQIDRAEKKLMEILGQKNIHNSDYLEFEKIKMKYYSNLN